MLRYSVLKPLDIILTPVKTCVAAPPSRGNVVHILHRHSRGLGLTTVAGSGSRGVSGGNHHASAPYFINLTASLRPCERPLSLIWERDADQGVVVKMRRQCTGPEHASTSAMVTKGTTSISTASTLHGRGSGYLLSQASTATELGSSPDKLKALAGT